MKKNNEAAWREFIAPPTERVYRNMTDAELRRLGKIPTPNYTGRRVAVWTPHKSWAFDETQNGNGQVRFTKRGALGKRRKKRVKVEKEKQPRVVKQREQKVRSFKVGDYVLFNPQREDAPTCVDGVVRKVRPIYDRRAQEFAYRLTIEQTGALVRWTVRHPGVPIRRVVRK